VKPAPVEHTIFFALGSNLGDSMMTLRRAAEALAKHLDDVRCSAVYRTPPERGADQPPYLNAAVGGRGSLTPRTALELAHRLEHQAGRRRPYPGASRTLDVDVLFVGDAVVHEPDLSVPHPRWSSRDFVVVPLLDVAPEWTDPETGRSVAEVGRDAGWSSARFPVVAEPGILLSGVGT
jgi:2-amino-4-hydroxy-6-hydroxymethyldihydropteridine diphosphokinase